MEIRRREFIKTMGVIGVGALVFSPILEAFAAEEGKKGGKAGDVGTWYPSTCQGCTTWCPIQVLIQNGRAVKIRGNSNSNVNPGMVCPRGHFIPQEMYDPDRLKTPMMRTNPLKGKGIDPQFVPMTWDAALTAVGNQLMTLRSNNEPQKLLYLRGRYAYTTDIQYTSFTKLFGTPNKFSHSSICAEAEKTGPYYTENYWGYRDYDLNNCRYLLLWGVDPFRSNRMVPATIANLEGIKTNGGKITVVDPVMTSSAAKAHTWAPIIPGQDGALAVALAHQILVTDGWHKPFVGDFNNGTNQFVAGATVLETDFTEITTNGIVKWWNLELKDRTPAWAEGICGVSASTIIQMAADMVAVAPNVSVWLGPGPSMAPRGLYTAMAIHALNGLLGSTENVGGTYRQPSVPTASNPTETSFMDAIATAGYATSKIGAAGTLGFPAIAGPSGRTGITNDVANAMIADPNAVKVCIANWANFAFSCCDTSRWYTALAALPYFVHITTNASETSMFADILLPAAHPTTERYSFLKNHGNLYSEATIQQPIATRLFDVRSDENEISYLLAEKLASLGFANILNYYNASFVNPDTLAAPTNYSEFAQFSTMKYLKPVYDTFTGGWNEYKDTGVKAYGPATLQQHWGSGGTFGTVTNKFEFMSETLRSKLQAHATTNSSTIDLVMAACNYLATGELVFVPHYEPPLRHGSLVTYPLTFIDAKSRFNREGRSANAPLYYQFKKLDPGDENWSDVIKINPTDAATYGITDGALVNVTSQLGTLICKAKLWEGIRPGTVSKCFGQGHWAYGRFASADFANALPNGGNNNDILVEDYERISGSTARNGGFVGVNITLV